MRRLGKDFMLVFFNISTSAIVTLEDNLEAMNECKLVSGFNNTSCFIFLLQHQYVQENVYLERLPLIKTSNQSDTPGNYW